MSHRHARAVSTLVLASALWGISATGTKYCLREFDPATLLAVQLGGAALVLGAVLVWRGYRPPQSWRLAAVLGTLEPGCAYLGQNLGLVRTSASNAAVVSGLESTFVVVLAAVFLRERASRRAVLAVVVGLAGLLVLERASGSAPSAGVTCSSPAAWSARPATPSSRVATSSTATRWR